VYIARIGEIINADISLVGKPEGNIHSEDLDMDGKIILEWILGKYGGKMRIGWIWLRTGTIGGLLWTR
jgi:hypothetical protein